MASPSPARTGEVAASPPPALAMAGVRKRWSAAAGPVLDGVDLEVARGDLVHVRGGNGTGKTTLLRIAAALLDPDEGTVRVAGVDLARDRRRALRHLGMLSAGGGLYARLPVVHNLRWWARAALVPRRQTAASVQAALAFWGLEAFAERRVERLSMGQRQRVRLAMTFLPAPALVLLDEPLTSLDTDGADLVLRACGALCERGGAVVWSAPTADAGAAVATRALALAGGRLEAAA